MPRTPAEKALAEIWASVLNLDRVGVLDSFFDLGGDSIMAIQVISRARRAGLDLTLTRFLDSPTIAGLAVGGTDRVEVRAEQGAVSGDVPLIPIEQWFFEHVEVDEHHWNQSVMLQLRQRLDPEALGNALRAVVSHHDALRLRYRREEDGWRQWNAEAEESEVLVRLELADLDEQACSQRIEKTAAELQTSLDLEKGPLIRVALFDPGPARAQRLLVILHHLAVDGLSWRLFFEDLQTTYASVVELSQASRGLGGEAGAGAALPPKTSSYKQWADCLVEHAQSEELLQELDYWRRVVTAGQAPFPIDLDAGPNLEGSGCGGWFAMSEDETRLLLRDAPAAFGVHVNDVLLTALTRAFVAWTGGRSLLVDVVVHGREDLFPEIDVSRTMGWFTTIHPEHLDLGAASHAADQVARVKATRDRIPNHGIGYGLLRYLCDDPAVRSELASLPTGDVLFSYVGQFEQVVGAGSLFNVAREHAGDPRSPRAMRSHLIEVGSLVVGGRLRFTLIFSEHVHRRETAERLIQELVSSLRELAAGAAEGGEGTLDGALQGARPIEIQWRDFGPTQVFGGM